MTSPRNTGLTLAKRWKSSLTSTRRYVRAAAGLAEVDGRRQPHVLQAVLPRDALVLEGAVQVARLEQGDQLDAGAAQDEVAARRCVSRISGTSMTSTPPASRVDGDRRREAPHHHVLEEVRVVVLALRQLQQHERAVAGGVEARVGQPEAHVRLA